MGETNDRALALLLVIIARSLREQYTAAINYEVGNPEVYLNLLEPVVAAAEAAVAGREVQLTGELLEDAGAILELSFPPSARQLRACHWAVYPELNANETLAAVEELLHGAREEHERGG